MLGGEGSWAMMLQVDTISFKDLSFENSVTLRGEGGGYNLNITVMLNSLDKPPGPKSFNFNTIFTALGVLI